MALRQERKLRLLCHVYAPHRMGLSPQPSSVTPASRKPSIVLCEWITDSSYSQSGLRDGCTASRNRIVTLQLYMCYTNHPTIGNNYLSSLVSLSFYFPFPKQLPCTKLPLTHEIIPQRQYTNTICSFNDAISTTV